MLEEKNFLLQRFYIYQQKYSPWKAMMHLMCFYVKMRFSAKRNLTLGPSNSVYMACFCKGGVGDVITQIAFLHHLLKFTKEPIVLFLFVDQRPDNIGILASKLPFIKKIYPYIEKNKYLHLFDIVLTLNTQFPRFFIQNYGKCQKFAPVLLSYIQESCKWNETHKGIVAIASMFSAQYWCLVHKKTMLTAMDTPNKLNLDKNAGFPIELQQADIVNVLEKFKLKNKKIITVQYSTDINNLPFSGKSIKFYPLKHWQKMLSMLKALYPSYTIVQLGVSGNEEMPGVDLRLIGQTSFYEYLVLLQYSSLHIDQEGGAAHIRHYLCRKPTVVLFGPTSHKVRGYDENINLRIPTCGLELCEWLDGNRWYENCPKYNDSVCSCLEKISPEMVVETIRNSHILEEENPA